jgi:hypothetical protein
VLRFFDHGAGGAWKAGQAESLPFGFLCRAKSPNCTAKLVVRGGVEPPAFRFSGASAASLHVAGQGLMGYLAAKPWPVVT